MRRKNPVPQLPLFGAATVLVLGLLLMVRPQVVLDIFPPLLGAVLAVAGAMGVAHTAAMRGRLVRPFAKLLLSVLQLVAGLVFVFKRDMSLAFLTLLFGIYVLGTAAVHVGQAAEMAKQKRTWLPKAAEGIFQLVLGALLLLAPIGHRLLWARFLGLHFVVAAMATLLWLHKEKP